ncbi:helix-turn-helix domain-containing protein [Paraclostridium bifermentans]|uniref:helix-turn-helix domain-containing protein n=1 Tax=Paraclostridium bifermentans TaxID=1490 RepID=UPI0022E82F02|nr:helix-turn-helix domain-containing protein [Paraclostridium bifermentans]
MAIEIQIGKLLQSKGKSRYWLAKEVGISHQNLTKIVKNETNSIKFDLLEKLCIALDCTPNDILNIKKTTK